jgi:pentose-5-phosphate-3-epimerase
MCANLARLEDDLIALEAAGCDELHFDSRDIGVPIESLV